MNILVVEDGMDKRRNIRRVLEETGFVHVECSRSYFSARNRIFQRQERYDMVIVDMFLPDAKDDRHIHGSAGKDFIFDLYNHEVHIPALIVTQYTYYVDEDPNMQQWNNQFPKMLENQKYHTEPEDSSDTMEEYECMTYEGLHDYLVDQVPDYLGIVFYTNQSEKWEDEVKYFVNKVRNTGI